MEQSQNEVRRAAAAAFKQSLNQLEQQLQTAPAAELADEPTVNPSDLALPLAESLPPIDLQALEDAAADIERLMRSKTQEPEGS
jgi:hypothetical protein